MNIATVLEGSAFVAGVAMGMASIMSIGPNNLTLVREGLVRGRAGLAATLVWTSYAVLLAAALLLGDVIARHGPFIKPLLSWLGLLALCWFAFLSLRAYFSSTRAVEFVALVREPARDCVGRILAIVWCNPLTYIEALLIPAAVSCSFMMPICRVLFCTGMILTTTMGCYGFAFGGSLLSAYVRHDSIRIFDLGSGVILSILAIVMATGLVLTAS